MAKQISEAKHVSDLMTKYPVKLEGSASVIEAARQMRAANVGAVIVEEEWESYAASSPIGTSLSARWPKGSIRAPRR